MSERAFQDAVVELAKTLGWRVGHFADSRREVKPGVFVGDKLAAGIPDLLLVRERTVFAELKDTKGRLGLNQREWLDALYLANAEVYLWRPPDFEEISSVLQAKRSPWELRPAWIPVTRWRIQ